MSNKSILTINNQPLSERDFMSTIDNEIIHLHDTGDINRVMKVLDGIKRIEDVTGQAKAKLLWGANEWWKIHKPSENFTDHVTSTSKTVKATVDRYLPTWQYIDECVIPKEIQSRPMRDLVPIAMTLKQGYDISKEQWRKIDMCGSDGELRDILRTIKGKAERKSARVIKLARDGSLYGWKDNKKYFLGFLNVKDAQDDKVLSEFIEKIKISAGVIDE